MLIIPLPIHDDEEPLNLLKPYFTTNELHKYFGDCNNTNWIIYTDSSFKHNISIKPYPKIKKHLDKFSEVITSDNAPYGLHRARNEYFFVGDKIISLRKCAEPTFTYTDFDCYVSQTFFVIKSNRIDMRYLTALLNSNLIKFWLKNKGKMQGNLFQVDKEPLKDIPVVKAPTHIEKKVSSLIQEIINKRSRDLASDISLLEKEINALIYGVYELTPEDVEVVETSI